jgi:polar amino acid transport system substrate-binding protein
MRKTRKRNRKPVNLPIAAVVLWASLVSASPALCKEFIFNSSYSPPNSTPDETGILDTLLKECFRRLGHTVDIRMLPAERCLRDSNAGIADGEVGRVAGIDILYPNLIRVPEPIIESRDFVAFSIRHRFNTPSWKSLAPYNVGIVKGWKILEVNATPAKTLLKVASTTALFTVLARDRIDVALSARTDGTTTARKLGIAGRVRIMEPPLASLKLYLYLHRTQREWVGPVNRTLQAMKQDGTFKRLRKAALNRKPN